MAAMQSWETNSVINLLRDSIYFTLCSALRIAFINVKTMHIPYANSDLYSSCFTLSGGAKTVRSAPSDKTSSGSPRNLPELRCGRRPGSFSLFSRRDFGLNGGQIPNSPIQPDLHRLCFPVVFHKLHTWPTSAVALKELKLSLHLTAYSFISSQHSPPLPPLLILLLCVWHNKRKSFSRLQATVCNFRSL